MRECVELTLTPLLRTLPGGVWNEAENIRSGYKDLSLFRHLCRKRILSHSFSSIKVPYAQPSPDKASSHWIISNATIEYLNHA